MDTTATTSRSSAVWWTLIFLPALVLSLWMALWLQWLFPMEDDLGIIGTPFVVVLVGIFTGLVVSATQSRRSKPIVIAAGTIVLAPWFVLPSIFVWAILSQIGTHNGHQTNEAVIAYVVPLIWLGLAAAARS